MPRVAFRMRIRAGKEAQYDEAHKNVWPALLAKLKSVGDFRLFDLSQGSRSGACHASR